MKLDSVFSLREVPLGSKAIKWISPQECYSCFLGSKDYQHAFYFSAQSYDVQPMLIISISPNEFDILKNTIYRYNTDIPIWIDSNLSFYKMNGHIPQDIRFHSFLVDSVGQVLFVGDLELNKNIIVNSIQKHD